MRLFQQNSQVLLSVLMVGLLGRGEAMAVSNDYYESALSLGQGVVTWQGTNVGADIEPNEPAGPFGVRTGTVWYSWQATATGWWKVDTEGSDFDTVLALGTGTTMADYEEIAVNNDTPEGNRARIIFYAESGDSFQIAIGGAAGAEGQVNLTIGQTAEPHPRLTASTMNPAIGEIEVSTFPELSLEVDIVSPGVFAFGQVSLCRENGGLAYSRIFNFRQRTSGSYVDGHYSVPLEFSIFLPPGTYYIDYKLMDHEGNQTVTGMSRWSTVASGSEVLKQVVITNAGTADFIPPTLSASNTPEPVDFAYGSSPAVFLLDVADDTSGVHGGRIVLHPMSGGLPLEFDFDGRVLVSGNENAGRYQVSCEIQPMPATVCESEIVLFDRAGNISVYKGPSVLLTNSLSGYNEWATARGLSGAASLPESDLDHDGIINTLEYAFGMEPDCPNTESSHAENIPTIRYTGDRKVIVEYTRRLGTTDIEYHAEGSRGFTFDSPIPETSVLWNDGVYERVHCEATLPSGAKTFFTRVRVELLQF